MTASDDRGARARQMLPARAGPCACGCPSTWHRAYHPCRCDGCVCRAFVKLVDLPAAEATVREWLTNPSNHLMCRACWARGFRERGRDAPMARLGFRVIGACCYCGSVDEDAVPYGDPPHAPRLRCLNRHDWRAGARPGARTP